MKKRRFLESEVDAMEEFYLWAKKKLESPRASTPENEYINGGKREYSKLITEMSFVGKWLGEAKKRMIKDGVIETWELIRAYIPTKPSIRTLQSKWREWKLPIRRGIFSSKVYIRKKDLEKWLEAHDNLLEP